jgi:ligand-binding SRPBCC domain-containing protein
MAAITSGVEKISSVKTREFNASLWLPLPPEKLFPFFADASNLNALTPPWLHFQILTPAVEMRAGALISYKLRVRGIPLVWRTSINKWNPPFLFVDEQISGPFRKWIHTHTFETRDGGTVIHDHVLYATPFDFLVHRWLVRPDIERIFRYRAQELTKRFSKKS